ncbi:MAG: adenosylcobinamide amidohydrolase [Candidatus Bathyarchaeota archaeon]|nr:adenosylcobinamide amidohydrolase [Candidatus Bathyarchaeota archaeon]
MKRRNYVILFDGVLMKRRELKLNLDNVKAEILYHRYQGFDLNTLLVGFGSKRRVLSTWEGFKDVCFVANVHHPDGLSEITMYHYDEFEQSFPASLGVDCDDLAMLSTGAHMDNLAVCEKSFKDLRVCCLATGGVGNALRSGVDVAEWVEQDGKYVSTRGTINIFVLTNAALTDGAMARAIITATEAKTAALQDMDARSCVSPDVLATGTGTDNMIVVSGCWSKAPLVSCGGHTKVGELIGVATKVAVAETIKRHEASVSK